jgi:signal transduction histidine kinase/HAMP domain-containing protein/ActR/RegA family two-component response regulator
MKLSTRFALAIGALVIATAGTVGVLAYRSVAAIAIPRTLLRADAHVRALARDLATLTASAQSDLLGFRRGMALLEIVRLSAGSSNTPIAVRDDWRDRVALRLAVELEARPNYSQYRLIGVADGGREIIRVERNVVSGLVRIAPDADLHSEAEQDYFRQTITAPRDSVVVSPVEFEPEPGVAETGKIPVVRVSSTIYSPDGQPFGIFVITIDMRPAFATIAAAARPDTALYVVNAGGEYLAGSGARPASGRAGKPFRIQDAFRALGPAMATGEQQPAVIEDRDGTRFGVALASVRLGDGPRLSVMEAIPEDKIVGVAMTAIRDSSLLGGILAVLGASILAFLLARTLTRPLRQLTVAVSGFGQGRPLAVPSGAGGEIGLLARAFEQMAGEVSEKTAAIRRDAAVFDTIMTSMGEAVLMVDQRGQIIYENNTCRDVLKPPPGISGSDWSNAYELVLPDGITPLPYEMWPITRCLQGEQLDRFEAIYRARGDGKKMHVMGSATPVRDAAGTLTGAILVFRDVTEAKEIERQLQQSQKLDALGQLTGGVAHDFNNMLTVISGVSEILAESMTDPELRRLARLMDQAAARGAELTRHLLSFARRQPLEPRDVDVNALVIGTAQLLRPTLGEQIEIESMLGEDVCPAHIDPSQLSAALLNLAVNARDAMPRGGKLTLETSNVTLDEAYAKNNLDIEPGVYVLIAVSDTGTGIPAALREKVFEPFFTTKEIGRGTGLGLSMVYGFVKQSNGHIKIYSEEGYGTTIKLYLPQAHAQAALVAAAPAITGGGETILVVEDDPLVREFAVAQLRSLGYATVTAANGALALAQVESGTPFDLLFTDVIMPGGMNGRQLADQIAKRVPELKVLYTSGYAENAIVHHGRLDPGVLLLAKPYRKADLARMVRAAVEKDSAEVHGETMKKVQPAGIRRQG